MAEEFGQGTEAPTPRRREEAREQGRVVFSVELSTGLLLLAALGILWLASRSIGASLFDALRHGVRGWRMHEMDMEQTREFFMGFLSLGLRIVGLPLALLFVTALGVVIGQVGFRIVPSLAAPNWGRVDPVSGWNRILSWASLLRGGTSLAKVIAIGVMSWIVLKGRMAQLAMFDRQHLASAVGQTWELVLRLGLMVAAAFIIVGVVDYLAQRFRFEMSLRMTREEIKDEMKREEGDPAVKGRIRKLAREMSQRRMMRDVPSATVVVTNPTHLAIALRYERGSLGAPKVVAKGAGHVARRIVETARRHGVPVVERKPVAQALYKAADVGREIPAALYHAVAEVLAYVYRLRGIA
jgi:flagellar biosynthetic protein FlhB